MPPLHFAVAAGRGDLVDLLLNAGADIDALGFGGADRLGGAGFRPVALALWRDPYWGPRDDLALARHLLARGADYSPAVAAALGDEARVEELLRAAAASANLPEACGKRPLSRRRGTRPPCDRPPPAGCRCRPQSAGGAELPARLRPVGRRPPWPSGHRQAVAGSGCRSAASTVAPHRRARRHQIRRAVPGVRRRPRRGRRGIPLHAAGMGGALRTGGVRAFPVGASGAACGTGSGAGVGAAARLGTTPRAWGGRRPAGAGRLTQPRHSVSPPVLATTAARGSG